MNKTEPFPLWMILTCILIVFYFLKMFFFGWKTHARNLLWDYARKRPQGFCFYEARHHCYQYHAKMSAADFEYGFRELLEEGKLTSVENGMFYDVVWKPRL